MFAAAFSPRGVAHKTTLSAGKDSSSTYRSLPSSAWWCLRGRGSREPSRTSSANSGTEGDDFVSAEEKAYREAMKVVASKEAKDWTLGKQEA